MFIFAYSHLVGFIAVTLLPVIVTNSRVERVLRISSGESIEVFGDKYHIKASSNSAYFVKIR